MKNLHNALLLKQLYQLKQLGYCYTDINISQQKESDLILPSSMEALSKQASNCHLCPLSKSRTNVVFGEGNINAKVLFVSESPTTAEDSVGRPFAGRTGELLSNMIEKVLLVPRAEVYVTHIVKCHPPISRTPSATEAHTCLPYLQKQIESIEPKLIVTLGESAYHYLTGDETAMADIRGTVQKRANYSIIPTLSLSYLLRNPSAKKDVFVDMKLVKSLMS